MSVGWSSEAKTKLQSRTCEVLWRTYIDVITSLGVYEVNEPEITDYVLKLPPIERSSSIIAKNWETHPITLPVNNQTSYFTPNIIQDSRTAKLDNIWQRGWVSGEADFRLCKVYIEQSVKISTGWETKRRFQGMIIDLNFIIAKSGVVCEIIARSDVLDALSAVFTTGDGFSLEQNPPP